MTSVQKFLLLGIVLFSAIFVNRTYTFLRGASGDALSDKDAQASASTALSREPRISENAFVAPSRVVTSEGRGATSVFHRVSNDGPPFILSEAALVSDLKGGTIYYEKNALRNWPLASVTKLMTAVVATDLLDPDSVTDIEERYFPADEDRAKNALVPHGRYTVRDLLYAALIPSNNVAAEALANSYGRERFILEMNRRADLWGMRDTFFDDPTGLSASNQSTARDILALVRNIHETYPDILHMSRLHEAYIPNLATGETKTITSTNFFAGTEGFLGGKTGFTDEAAGNLVSVFSIRYEPVLIVVLGTDDRFGDTDALFQWFSNVYRTGN